MKTKTVWGLLAASLAVGGSMMDAHACDVCAISTAIQYENPQQGAVRLGVAEQFTYLDTIRDEGHYVENEANQFLKSSATQLSLQYDSSPTTALQLVLPVIGRSFRRVEDGEIQRDSVFGIGDLSMFFHYVPVQYSEGENLIRFRLFGGIELPTGDAHYLGEEAEGHDDEMSAEEDSHHFASLKHGGEADESDLQNAVHGHDIALGSGSFDFPLGAGLTTQWERFLFSSDVQYTIRTEGAYSYQYANDWFWSTSLGRYVYFDKDTQVILRARLSGQYKREDTLKGGEEADDTALNAKFLGPELIGLIAQQWQGNIGFDLPIDVKNSDYHVTPSWSLRAGVTYRF